MDKISIDELRAMPFRLPNDPLLKRRIIKIVEELQEQDRPYLDYGSPLLGEDRYFALHSLEEKLDNAIFDLFELTESERDLVRNMRDFGIDAFYRGENSRAFERVSIDLNEHFGTLSNLEQKKGSYGGIIQYLEAFLKIWNLQLESTGEFNWQLIVPMHSSNIAAIFETQKKGDVNPKPLKSEEEEWRSLLCRFEKRNCTPFGSSRILTEDIVRVVTDTEIIIVKPNQQRLWTRSAAYEDAEATLLQAIRLQEANNK
jgi:hypothetical protein